MVFGGKENVSSVDATHRANPNVARKFGTPLRSNVDKLQRHTQSSIKKKVRVRRTPQSTPSYKSKAVAVEKYDRSTLTPPGFSFSSSIGTESLKQKTIVLSPGPIGFQLEPLNEAPMYGCRVTRFVDGGPNNPGQARKSGIKPGDLVLKVEDEGTLSTGTTHDEIINILMQSHTKRIITVQSTYESQGLNIQNLGNGISLPSPLKLPEPESIDEALPKSDSEKDMIHESRFENTLPSLSSGDVSPSQTSPTRNGTILVEATNGPIIVPLSKGTRQSSFGDSESKSMDASFSSQDTTKSSNKSTTASPRQSLSHQFLLLDDSVGTFEPDTSQAPSGSVVPTVDDVKSETEYNESEQSKIHHCNAAEQHLQQAENSSTSDHHAGDIFKSGIKQQQSFFEESLARADYEQRLQVARREHSKAERELKDLYIHTCEKNESKIRQLEVDRDILQNALEENSLERTFLNNTRIRELEKQVAEAEKVKMRNQVEAREKIRAKTNEYSRLVAAKENEWRKKFDEQENEIKRLREESDSRLIELDMSRTMATEMEARILRTESEKDEIASRLEKASRSILKLEDSIFRRNEEDQAKERVLQDTQEKLKKILKENKTLVKEKESYESFKEETSVLTQKLAESVREKQKTIIESQSIASKLEAANDDLTKEIAESMSDVEQLVQEKLQLEEKLALTWKDIEKTKNDASTIHETLLEKLENGEYYTSADVEEKEITIQTLEKKLKSIRGVSNDALIKSNKKMIVLHLQLREAEQKLVETKLLNTEAMKERDDWHKESIQLGESLTNTKRHVSEITEMYRNEMLSSAELKAGLENLSKSKIESDLQYQKSIESLSLQLESKNNELLSYEGRLDEMESQKNNAITTCNELKAEVEGVMKSKEDASVQYQKSIESISLQLESKRSELLSCEGRLDEMTSLKKKQEAITTRLEAQLEAMACSNNEVQSQYQKKIESLSSELESKTIEFSDQLNSLKTMESNLRGKIGLLQDEKDNLAAGYEDQVEALGARLQIESQKLNTSKETEEKMLQSIESLTKEAKESEEKIEALTDSLQSQCEEFSCLELRSQILEEDYDSLKLEHEKILDRIDMIKAEKTELESSQEEAVKELKSELQSKESLLESTADELRTTIESMKSANESASTQYWESIQELTTELQSKTEELSEKQSILKDMEEDIKSSKMKIQELEHGNFEKDTLAEDMRAQIASKTKLLGLREAEKAEAEQIISDLESRINELEIDMSDKLELQHSHEVLKKSVVDLEMSKERMSVEYCSEIFRFVKRLAILNQTHSDVNEQRKKAMEIAVVQRKWQAQAKLHIQKLEKKLKATTDQAVQLENKLRHDLNMQKEKEKQFSIELGEKTKQLEHQNVMSSSLQVEVSALIRLTKHLEDTKERELGKLKEENEKLQSELSSEKKSNARSASDTSDALMELKMMDKKYNSIISSKDEALLRSENSRTTIARSLLQANAVVASLRVQMKENDTSELLQQSMEKIELLDQTVCNLRTNLEDKDRDIENLIEENKAYEETSSSLKEDLHQTKVEYEGQVEMMQQQVLSVRANLIAKHAEITSYQHNEKMLNNQLLLLQDACENERISKQALEHSFQKRILMLQAHCISKHLEEQTLQKEIYNLHQSRNTHKMRIDELEETNSRMCKEMEEMNENITENERLNEQLQWALKRFDKNLDEGGYRNNIDTPRKVKLKQTKVRLLKNIEDLSSNLISIEESMKQGEILHKDTEDSLKRSISKLRAEYVAKHLETNDLKKKIAVLRQGRKLAKKNEEELHTTVSNLKAELESTNTEKSILEEKFETSNNELAQYRKVVDEREQNLVTLNNKICVLETDITDLRVQLKNEKKLRQVEVANLEKNNSKLNNLNASLHKSFEDAKSVEVELEAERNAHSALQEMVHETQMRYNESENYVTQLQNETNNLRTLLIEKEELMSKLKRDIQQLKLQSASADNEIKTLRTDPPVLENEMSDQLSSIKDAFSMQAAVLEDVKLSESMLETLIKEVMKLATQFESEMLELSSVLGTVEDLLLNPSSLLASLDLAGIDSIEFYFGEVRSRLEDLAAQAYTTSVELNNRQNQLAQWMSNRAQSPQIPVTPPSNELKRTLFDRTDIKPSHDITPVITDGAKEVRDKIAGARLLCCILENHNKIKLASAFRKWTCAAGTINASSNASGHKETVVELAHELEITREKLLTLKSHLKTGRMGKQKPRLRRILERLDGNSMNHGDGMDSKRNTGPMVPMNVDHTLTAMNEHSFEL